tara:strand:+ start:936 stop:1085 length:150 start_codon:yes stop_codon:yes gene_type:complete
LFEKLIIVKDKKETITSDMNFPINKFSKTNSVNINKKNEDPIGFKNATM